MVATVKPGVDRHVAERRSRCRVLPGRRPSARTMCSSCEVNRGHFRRLGHPGQLGHSLKDGARNRHAGRLQHGVLRLRTLESIQVWRRGHEPQWSFTLQCNVVSGGARGRESRNRYNDSQLGHRLESLEYAVTVLHLMRFRERFVLRS